MFGAGMPQRRGIELVDAGCEFFDAGGEPGEFFMRGFGGGGFSGDKPAKLRDEVEIAVADRRDSGHGPPEGFGG